MAKARIAVIGAGLMGHGIAQVFALAGHDVTITDTLRRASTPRKRGSPRASRTSATIRARSSA